MIKSKANIPMLRTLAATVQEIPGDVVEFGVYQGGSAAELCRLFPGRQVHLFDSCQGLPPKRGPKDGDHPGSFAATCEKIQEAVDSYDNWTLHVGWFADSLRTIGNIDLLCFAHIDCDYEQSYRDCVPWVLQRLAVGGVVVFDDYGCANCRGATGYLDRLLGGEIVKSSGHGAYYRKVADA